MRVLVTGGAGFIGSCLVRKLVKNKFELIVNYDKLTYAGNLENVVSVSQSLNYQFVQGDICDQKKFQLLLTQYRPNIIFHLAAESHVDRSIHDPYTFIKTNIEGTYQLLQASQLYYKCLTEKEKKVFKFIHISTDEVFGALGKIGYFNECSPYSPNSPYSASKASSDHLVRSFYKTYGLPTIITNCSNNFGPYQYTEKLIPVIIKNALLEKKIPIYGNGQQIRDWLYVEDHVEALIKLVYLGGIGEQYCIGGGVELSNIDLAELICDILDKKLPKKESYKNLITYVPDRQGHDFRYAIDASKIKKTIGWLPSNNFYQCLENTVFWYKKLFSLKKSSYI